MAEQHVILIVDDTPENLVILGNLLEKDGYEVLVATSGPMSLEIAATYPHPELILLDIMMPGMDGYEVNRRLKSDPELRTIPVIFISALDMQDQKIQAFREGAVDYVTKPFQAEEVMARVHTHIQLSRLEDLKHEIAERKLAEQEKEKLWNQLQMLVEESMALSAEKDLAKLVTLILHTAKDLVNADGGVLYLLEGDVLEVEILSLSSENLVLGGLSKNPAPRVMIRPAIMAFLEQDSVLRWACESFNRKNIVSVKDVSLTLFPTGLPKEPCDYPIRSLIAVPIITRQAKVIGVLQLFNARDKYTGKFIGSEHKDEINFISSLAAQAAVALDNRNLIASLHDLFDALNEVIAAAIDAKSPYTAGHCTRVPELVEMLAKALHETDEEPFINFRLNSDDDWRELHIAAWMHDCGKVTTPEYVVDKATKLETIYNRIHEIRMRFEVLYRDAEINYYRKLADGENDSVVLREELEDELKRLEDDFVFVAKCNIGGEFMSDSHKNRLVKIAQKTWLRHYSDRVGISSEELRLKGDTPEPELPATEYLLADKPEHIVPGKRIQSPVKDSQGNQIIKPENDFNRGEVYNLSIPRGTLTDEERFKINEHVLIGFEMLNKIPFPESLRHVPDIACSHHETLAGTGYPFHKTEEQIPVVVRILTVADVFEALTAADRPYAKMKTLSEALRIMTFMRKDRQIDPDIFDFFLRSDVFRWYTEKYLMPSQMDVDDVSIYLVNAQT